MKKANKEHPVYVSLRDWSKVRKANTVAEKTERKEIKNGRSQTP